MAEDLGTLRWFGESWDAPVCDPRTHIETPVGMGCAGHEHLHEHRRPLITEGDQGVSIPWFSTDRAVGRIYYHLTCWLHEVGVDRLVSFTCPRCGRTSANPNDIREGYCGNCHAWTGSD